jgi:hypothetical protein
VKVIGYEPALGPQWDAFVAASRNGTFLFERGYMDYHADRFADASLVVLEDDGAWVAVLPANRRGDVVDSHGGLTYGGFVVGPRMTTGRMLEVFEATGAHLHALGVARVRYKTVPWIYHRHPSEEDRYALFRHDARLYRRDVLTVARPGVPLPYQERRRRGIKKAQKQGVRWAASDAWGAFWSMLEATLAERHAARPVHSLAEIELLRGRFPERVKLFGAFGGGGAGNALLAGVVVYETGTVAHAQYIAASPAGRELGALDLIFDGLLAEVYRGTPWFDFGISNEDDGRVLNAGLIEQKEGFGGRAVVHDFYEWDLARAARGEQG